jgi:ubiquinone biosynthesis accessory factor UbiJ
MSTPALFTPLLNGLNHLLVQEPWAREHLHAHANKVACLASELFAIKLQVTADGMLQNTPDNTPADVTIRIKMADLPFIMHQPERAFAYVKLEGDADFAHTISYLGQNLRWEAEHDLQQWVGSIAANRMVAGAKAAVTAAKTGQQKLAENLAEYFLEENPLLVRPEALAQLSADINKTRDDVERLAKRIQKLATKLT